MAEENIDSIELFTGLVESDWDSIEDLPDFVTLPLGSFILHTNKAEVGTTQDGSKGAINIVAEVKETLELAIDGDEPPKEGSLSGMRFTGSLGVKMFKKLFQDVGRELGANGPAETLEMLANGVDIAVTVTHRKDKDKVDEKGQPIVYASWNTVTLA